MTRRYSSTAQPTTLSAGCTSAATTIQVTATTGFPAVDFILALDYGAAGQELVLCTNVAGTTLTVTRGYNSTPASAHSLGAAVRHVHGAIDFTDSRTHEAASAAVHGIAGSVVGTTDVQAMSNKDLSSGTNTFPGTLASTTGAQTLTNKTVALGSNTVSGTRAQFNTAMTDDDFASLTGTETLTNKTVALGSNTVSGTRAQFNTAMTDDDFASLTGTETLTNKTLTGLGASSNLSGDFIGGRRYILKTVDENLASNTTFQDDDALTFTVSANATYVVEQAVAFTAGGVSGNNGGFKGQITMPAGATCYDVGGDSGSVSSSASPVALAGIAANASGINSAYTANFRVKTSATAGSVTLQWAQAGSNVAQATVGANSYWLVRRVA
jgi:hypothetical protein